MKRRKLSKKSSRKNFSRGNRVNGKNGIPTSGGPMRGGIRL